MFEMTWQFRNAESKSFRNLKEKNSNHYISNYHRPSLVIQKTFTMCTNTQTGAHVAASRCIEEFRAVAW